MSIRSDAYRDAATGLLSRAAFRHELATYLDSQTERSKFGCLLLMRFPVLQCLARNHTSEMVDKAFCDILALLETRLRGRDNMGRLSAHSLCVHLRQCPPIHARAIARDYLNLMQRLDIEVEQQRFSVLPQLRVVSLDEADTTRPKAVTTVSHEVTVKGIQSIFGSSGIPVDTDVVAQGASSGIADVLAFDTRREDWRIEPSRWLSSANENVHMLRLRSLNRHVRVNNARHMLRILDSLSLNPKHRMRAAPTRLTVPAELDSLSIDTLRWLVDQTRERRVSPSDICFQFAADEASEQLRSALPLLRRLRRAGFRLMLSRVEDTRVLGLLQRALKVDYVIVSARQLQQSANDEGVSAELAALVESVHEEAGRVVVSGIDSEQLAAHAQALHIDLGFGRLCGRSQRFDSLSDAP